MLLTLYSIMATVFTGTIIYLWTVMKQIRDEAAFSREKNSILIQFFLFNVAFLSRAIYFGIELYKIYDVSRANDDGTRQEFSAALTETILYIPWNCKELVGNHRKTAVTLQGKCRATAGELQGIF